MKSFSLLVRDSNHTEHIPGVTSFVGEDSSGSFGILANHSRFMTVLSFGLAKFRLEATPWQYLALPGAVLYFVDNEMSITCRRFLRDQDYHRISELLEKELAREEQKLTSVKDSLRRMEEELMRRLWELR